MKIIIVANFSGYLDGSFNNRFVMLADMMARRGHQVELVTSDFCHGAKARRTEQSHERYSAFKVTLLHETGYKRNVSVKRLYSHWTWGNKVYQYVSKQVGIDVVYCAVPSLTAPMKMAELCKKRQIKYVVDLQDLWPEAFAMIFSSAFLRKMFWPMMQMANKSYAQADLAVGVSETYVDRILQVNKKLQHGLAVFLGNNGEEFDKGRTQYQLERQTNELVLGYIGNMSTSYDIPCVIDALAKVKERNKVDMPIRFVLIGGGVDEEKFKQYARTHYSNTDFLGLKNYSEMAGLMCGFDMVVNPIVKGSVASIINKVGDYAFSGKPVINTQESEEYRQLITKYQCGINCECGNSDQLADAIEKLALNPELRVQMGNQAAKLGREKFDRRYTYNAIVEAVEQLIK